MNLKINFYENIQIQNNLIHGSYLSKKFNFLGSAASILKIANNRSPKKGTKTTGQLEETNDAYSIAKIAGLKCVNTTVKNIDLITKV